MLELSQHGWGAILFALLIGHAFGDYAFQTKFVSEAKCAKFWTESETKWYWLPVLFAHSLIHAGMVWIVTGAVGLALAEFLLHSVIDKLKCDERFGFLTDQGLHVFCKIGFVVFLL